MTRNMRGEKYVCVCACVWPHSRKVVGKKKPLLAIKWDRVQMKPGPTNKEK